MGEIIKWNELSPAERDRLVAEKVMGWQPVQCDEGIELTVYDDGDAWCPRCHQREHTSSFEHGIIPPPAYTQSMDAAWLVLKRVVQLETADREDLTYELFGTTWGDLDTFST